MNLILKDTLGNIKFDHNIHYDESLADVNDNIKNTEILPSQIHGHGLFATKDILSGELLSKLDGQIVDYATFEKMKAELDLDEKAESALFMEWNGLPDDMLLVRMFRTKYSYINHSVTPNCKLLGSPPQVWSCCAIIKGEELTLDYRDEPLPGAYLTGHGASYLNPI
jgi:SET domain-containing protein